MDMILKGYKTPQAVIYKSESHKLHQAFNVRTGVTIIQGDWVVIDTDGRIAPYTASENIELVIGIAVTGTEHPAYPPNNNAGELEVTVACRGYMILTALANAALQAGPVQPNGTKGTGENAIYNRYVQYTPDGTTPGEIWGIALNTASAQDDPIKVLIFR